MPATASAGRSTSTRAWPSTWPGTGSLLVRAAVAAGVRVELAATIPGSGHLERRLKRWHKTGRFCPRCRAARRGKAR